MAAISNDWLGPLSPEFKKPYYAELYTKVKDEYMKASVYPPADEIFKAFELTSLYSSVTRKGGRRLAAYNTKAEK